MSGSQIAAEPKAPGGAPGWAGALVRDLTAWVMAMRRGPQVLTVYTMQTLPDATKWRGGQVQISNESGGETPAFSDGTNWRRYADRAVVS